MGTTDTRSRELTNNTGICLLSSTDLLLILYSRNEGQSKRNSLHPYCLIKQTFRFYLVSALDLILPVNVIVQYLFSIDYSFIKARRVSRFNYSRTSSISS
jgi:hypothetical protein